MQHPVTEQGLCLFLSLTHPIHLDCWLRTVNQSRLTADLRLVGQNGSAVTIAVMNKQRGFTLVELMVVIGIIALLTALAAPSFKNLIQSNAMSSAVNTFMADMRFARSEAMRRGGGVVMCRSDAPEAASPSCGSGSGPGGNGWVSGWFIFHDIDADGVRDSTDTVLRVQAPLTMLDSIVETGASSSTKFRFTATGRVQNLSSATEIQFGGNTKFSNELQRIVCVSLGGRARVAGDGTSSCGTDK